VAAGAFLIDAETRLNPAAGSIYFGGSGTKGGTAVVTTRPSMGGDAEAEVKAALAKLNPEDRGLAKAQGYCPVLGTRLGAMDTPVKLTLSGRVVFLCCQGCEDKARADEARTLEKVEQLKRQSSAASRSAPPTPKAELPLSAADEADIRAALAKLNAEDRKLAEAQRFCPIQDGSRLGSMGPPVKVMLNGRPVFLCCKGCRTKALADPDKALEKLERLRREIGAGH
jgi:hypothetical protein